MMYSLNMDDFTNTLNGITDDEISKYESTPIDNKLISWAKNNCKENYLSLKKNTLIENLTNSFDSDEELTNYFTAWDYSTDYLRTAMGLYAETVAAAIPTNDWSKNATFVLSNKKLYIINSGQYHDYINTITFDLNDPKSLEKINFYKDKDSELLEVVTNTSKTIYKVFGSHFSSLIDDLGSTYPISSKISIKKGPKKPLPLGKIVLYLFIIAAVLFGLSALQFTFTNLF